jgi:hypothetical protein
VLITELTFGNAYSDTKAGTYARAVKCNTNLVLHLRLDNNITPNSPS